MQTVDLPIDSLREAPWNPNQMDGAMLERLRRSIQRFGFLVPLVVRRLPDGTYEVIGGAQRLKVAREMGFRTVPCVVVDADDAHARLLAQALNHLHGEDDLGLRAEVLRTVLEHLPQEEVLAVLPETAQSLRDLATLGQETIAEHLQAWQQAQGARLRHLAFHLMPAQLAVVEETLARLMPQAKEAQGESPNARGTALYLLCRSYLEREGTP